MLTDDRLVSQMQDRRTSAGLLRLAYDGADPDRVRGVGRAAKIPAAEVELCLEVAADLRARGVRPVRPRRPPPSTGLSTAERRVAAKMIASDREAYRRCCEQICAIVPGPTTRRRIMERMLADFDSPEVTR